jgi:hypothetical protein
LIYKCGAPRVSGEARSELDGASAGESESTARETGDSAIRRNFIWRLAGWANGFFTVAGMMRKIEGRVQTYKPINVRNVQFEIQGSKEIIDLRIDQPWVLKNGDHVVVVGEEDGRSGKFNGYAYRNETRQIRGRSESELPDACRYLFLGLLFAWAIFPLFIHVPYGFRLLAFDRKVDQAAAML